MTLRPTRSIAAVAGLAALILVGASACGGSANTSTASSDKIVVVASTIVWGSVVQAVGGDLVSVHSIITDSTGDPHGYEAKPADAAAFRGAKLALSNGGGYDDFFTGLADNAGKDLRKIVAFDVDHGGEHESTTPTEGEHGHVNEHVWYDFVAVHEIATKVSDELSAIAPQYKDKFVANAAAFGGKLDALTTKAEAIGKAKPGTKVMATEPVAGFLLDHAGLIDATPTEFAEAVEEESDPSISAVRATEALITGKQVAALIYNEQTETPVTKSIKDKAAAAGIPIVTMTETFPKGQTDYVEWMTRQVDSLAGALAGT
jgi:zinc/manganese transport system substrate-binding protein